MPFIFLHFVLYLWILSGYTVFDMSRSPSQGNGSSGCRDYSCLSASIGFKFEAFHAG